MQTPAPGRPPPPLHRRFLISALSLLLAAAIWLPSVHWLFRPALQDYRQPRAVAPRARELAARHLALWEDPARRAAEIARMRAKNAEWDFMGRTFFVLALANMSIDEPQQASRYLAVIDAILDETLRLESERGIYFFLMDYARRRPFIDQPPRSTFIDGEIAMMLAARQMVRPDPRYVPMLRQRVDLLVQRLSRGPVMCGESYPDECWMFCNTVAVAAIHISDLLDGRDHSAFIQKWLATAKSKLVDPTTGLLFSSFTYDGHPLDGPEGSSIWTAAHCLKVVDPDFAAQQYRLARQQLGCNLLGLGYSREWPASWKGPDDIDSGPVIPLLGLSAGATGQAFLGAATFEDDDYLQQLLSSLQFGAFPIRDRDELRFAAGNQVGDAVLLYALVQGPLWEKCAAGKARQ